VCVYVCGVCVCARGAFSYTMVGKQCYVIVCIYFAWGTPSRYFQPSPRYRHIVSKQHGLIVFIFLRCRQAAQARCKQAAHSVLFYFYA